VLERNERKSKADPSVDPLEEGKEKAGEKGKEKKKGVVGRVDEPQTR